MRATRDVVCNSLNQSIRSFSAWGRQGPKDVPSVGLVCLAFFVLRTTYHVSAQLKLKESRVSRSAGSAQVEWSAEA